MIEQELTALDRVQMLDWINFWADVFGLEVIRVKCIDDIFAAWDQEQAKKEAV